MRITGDSDNQLPDMWSSTALLIMSVNLLDTVDLIFVLLLFGSPEYVFPKKTDKKSM
jgi:hypothetical protein